MLILELPATDTDRETVPTVEGLVFRFVRQICGGKTRWSVTPAPALAPALAPESDSEGRLLAVIVAYWQNRAKDTGRVVWDRRLDVGAQVVQSQRKTGAV